MFYEMVLNLCKQKGIAMTSLTSELKISKSNVTNWKNGSVPKSDKLSQIADYFGVSTDYLLGKETNKDNDDDIDLADYRIAAHRKNDPDFIEGDFTPEEEEEIKEFIRYVKSKRDKNK